MAGEMGVSVIRTGAANLASVTAAFQRLGFSPRIVESPDQSVESDALVLPGVGSFATGIAALRKNGWDEVLQERFQFNQPTLAICLGLQLLCRSSSEDPTSPGLGILETPVQRLPGNVTVPQFGWNQIESESPDFLNGYGYYANSYCLSDVPAVRRAGWEVATSRHGIRFVAAIRKGTWLGCQFHPELSGEFGQRLLRCWTTAIRQPDADKSPTGVSSC